MDARFESLTATQKAVLQAAVDHADDSIAADAAGKSVSDFREILDDACTEARITAPTFNERRAEIVRIFKNGSANGHDNDAGHAGEGDQEMPTVASLVNKIKGLPDHLQAYVPMLVVGRKPDRVAEELKVPESTAKQGLLETQVALGIQNLKPTQRRPLLKEAYAQIESEKDASSAGKRTKSTKAPKQRRAAAKTKPHRAARAQRAAAAPSVQGEVQQLRDFAASLGGGTMAKLIDKAAGYMEGADRLQAQVADLVSKFAGKK